MKEVFSDWQNKPLQVITKDRITKCHCDHGKRSQARANGGLQFEIFRRVRRFCRRSICVAIVKR